MEVNLVLAALRRHVHVPVSDVVGPVRFQHAHLHVLATHDAPEVVTSARALGRLSDVSVVPYNASRVASDRLPDVIHLFGVRSGRQVDSVLILSARVGVHEVVLVLVELTASVEVHVSLALALPVRLRKMAQGAMAVVVHNVSPLDQFLASLPVDRLLVFVLVSVVAHAGHHSLALRLLLDEVAHVHLLNVLPAGSWGDLLVRIRT